MRTLSPLLMLSVLCCTPSVLYGQKTWLGSDGHGGDGTWSEAASWAPSGAPTSISGTGNRAQFALVDGATKAVSNVAINGTAYSNAIQVGKGKTLNLSLNNAVLNTNAFSVGVDIANETGSGAAHMHVSGSGTASVIQLIVGFATTTETSGNSLTISGANLTVQPQGTVTASLVGRNGNDNLLKITDGATVNVYGLSTSTLNGKQNNGVIVESGASLNLSSFGLNLATSVGARSNYLTVQDNAQVRVQNGHGLSIGTASSFGGNRVEVGAGSSIRLEGTTTIASFNVNGGNNDGANRLTIQSGGAFFSSGTINNDGLLQLEEGGVLAGKTLNGTQSLLTVKVRKGGRFEAEGDGLDQSVETQVEAGGVFAVGTGDARLSATVLTLQSTVTMAAGSMLEVSLFGDGTNDRIEVGGDGGIELMGVVTFKLTLGADYVHEAGRSWTFFEGTPFIGTGSLDTTSLDTALWDLSQFNAAGGWQIAAIPEPGALSLVALPAFLALYSARRRATSSH